MAAHAAAEIMSWARQRHRIKHMFGRLKVQPRHRHMTWQLAHSFPGMVHITTGRDWLKF